MCETCWQKEGSPTEKTETTDRVVELIHALYRDHPTGGPLHCELDDWNVDHDRIEPHYRTGDAATDTCCDEICALLNAMTVEQRYAALACAEGFVS